MIRRGWLAGPLLGLVVVWVLFAVLAGGDFMRWDNQRLMLLQTAVVGSAAVGATLIIITGGIDLSVGSSIALGTVAVARLLELGVPAAWAALGGVLGAVVCGLLIGALVVGRTASAVAALLALTVLFSTAAPWGWPMAAVAALAVGATVAVSGRRLLPPLPLAPFIVTLGAWGALRGAAKGLADNQPVYPPAETWIQDLMVRGDGWLAPGVWIMLGLAALMAALLGLTVFGRHVYAIGSNASTARLCGVPVERTLLLTYAIGIGCAGVAALLQLSYLSMGDPTTASGYELKVIAAVVIGGASLTGGEGTIRGTLVGALIMTVVDNGCTKLGLDNWVQEIVTGGIILAAVLLDRARHGGGRGR